MNSSVYLTAHLSDIWKIELIRFLKGTPTWKSHLHLAVLCLLSLQIALKKIRMEGNKGNLLCFAGCVFCGFDSTRRELFALFISTELTGGSKSAPVMLAPGSAREELHSRDFGKAMLQEDGHQDWVGGEIRDGGVNPIVWCVSTPLTTAPVKAEQTREGFMLCLPKVLKTPLEDFQTKK